MVIQTSFYWATETPSKCLESPLHSAEVTVYVLFPVIQFWFLLFERENYETVAITEQCYCERVQET